MTSRITPWWQRGWQGWWLNQTTWLRVEDPCGAYDYEPRLHEVRWHGCLRAGDGRRWSIEILWGPGTPFQPPRIYVDGVYSRAHQLRDASLCLAPPGLSEVIEIDAWLEQTRHWLGQYVHEGWGIGESAWLIHRLICPDPGYRLHERPKSFLLIPRDWSPSGGHGEFLARVPPSRAGLGQLVGWRCAGESDWHDWNDGTPFVARTDDVLSGYWLSDWDGKIPAPAMNWLARIDEDQRPRLLGWRVQLNESSSLWQFARMDPTNDRAFWHRLVPFTGTVTDFILAEVRFHEFLAERLVPALPFDTQALEARTKASRSEQMDTRIRSACVVIVGLGSLGSEVAHLLAKEQVGRFVLIDGDLLLPGNIARHRLSLAAVGGNKADKLREHLLQHHPGASITVVPEMLDETLHQLKLPQNALLIGLTGDVQNERILADVAAHQGLPCVHAWTECDGRLLRLIRTLPGQDVGLHELRELPPMPWPSAPLPAAHCGELIQPGSSINLHAAANRTARLVLSVLGQASPSALPSENHVFFSAEGLGSEPPNIPPELRAPYGQLCARLERPS